MVKKAVSGTCQGQVPLAVPSILDRMPALQPKGQIKGLSHSLPVGRK